jgi:hypothetical protein
VAFLKGKGKKRSGFILGLIAGLMMFGSVYAVDLNGIKDTTTSVETTTQVTATQPVQVTEEVYEVAETAPTTDNDTLSNAQAVGSIFSNIGPSGSDFAQAKLILEPVTTVINLAMAIVLAAISLALFAITCIDMAYLVVPPIRRWLDGGRGDTQSKPGGMGDGFGGGPMGGLGQPKQPSSSPQGMCAQWVSDEALASYQETMGQGGNQPIPRKMMIIVYAKKRVVFLFCFGLCITLLFTTLFTDLGVNVGVWVIGKMSGLM